MAGFREILKSKGEVDLVGITQEKRINLDYGFKNKLVADTDGKISPFTVPHRNIQEMLRYRSARDTIRKSGIEARPELVLWMVAIKEARLRLRGGDAVAVTRMFLRGMLQDRFKSSVVDEL